MYIRAKKNKQNKPTQIRSGRKVISQNNYQFLGLIAVTNTFSHLQYLKCLCYIWAEMTQNYFFFLLKKGISVSEEVTACGITVSTLNDCNCIKLFLIFQVVWALNDTRNELQLLCVSFFWNLKQGTTFKYIRFMCI